jgi:ribosomal protein L11 methyltransferase
MKWMEAKVVFDFDDKQLAMDLISDIFYELGITGLVMEEPDIEYPEDWGKDSTRPDYYSVIGYFPRDEKIQTRRRVLEKNLASLEKNKGVKCKIIYSDMDESDWTNQWKAFFRPEKITDKIVVKPTWREYAWNPDEIILEIDPGMAFGTGTHPTTCMCVAMIEKYLNMGDSFLDVGTGSRRQGMGDGQ